MSVFHNNALIGASGQAAGGGGYQIERSLRFNSADSAYLSKDFASAGNRKTWTWAGWVKRSSFASFKGIFSAGSNNSVFMFNDDRLHYYENNGSTETSQVLTTQLFRDPSAWYHIVLAVDTTQATSSNRYKVYVNGSQITAFSTAVYPSQNYDTYANSTIQHYLGYAAFSSRYFDGYLADVHFIDGQALDPTSFGEFDTNGVWQPIEYAGTYGTNGFHLPFSDNSTAAALGTDTSGNGNDWTTNNVSVELGGPTSVAAATGALPIYNTTDTYGTVKGTGTRTDSNSSSIVFAVPMDGANGGTTFTDESATIKGSGSPKAITVNDTTTSTAQSKYYGSSGLFNGTSAYLRVAGSSDFAYGTGDFTIEAWIYPTSDANGTIFAQTKSGQNYLIFVRLANGTLYFASLGGGITSTLIAPKNQWSHVALCRQGTTMRMFVNGINSGTTTVSYDFTDTTYAPTIGTYSHASIELFAGNIQDFRVYKGAAKYTTTFNPPSATLNVSVAAANDSLVDTPTNYGTDTGTGGEVRGNYCTANPLAIGGGTLSNGNLDYVRVSDPSGGTIGKVLTTVAANTEKWYFEYTIATSSTSIVAIGVTSNIQGTASSLGGTNYVGIASYEYCWRANGQTINNASFVNYGTAASNGDVIMCAFDASAGKIWFGRNGTWFNSSSPSAGTSPAFSGFSGTIMPIFGIGTSSAGFDANGSINFGQRPFAYTAPSGFKALCTTNLPEPDPNITPPSKVMDVALYTGNGTSQTISGLGFSPDLVWIKNRTDNSTEHVLQDALRGFTTGAKLSSSSIEDEGDTTVLNDSFGYVDSATSDGFTLTKSGTGAADYSQTNQSTKAYVAWTWDAGSSTVTNNDGSITSQVRANPSAGFSVISWSSNLSSGTGTIGHGLGIAPSLIIVKDRGAADPWIVGFNYSGFNWNTDYLVLNSTAAKATDGAGIIFNTAPTSTVFTIGRAASMNGDMIAYCFAPVAGYSAFGSYTGNGSADGPFVYTGFRPKYLLVKSSSNAVGWYVLDSVRNDYNTVSRFLIPNASDAEVDGGAGSYVDFLSNGFKWRASNTAFNGSSYTYVWAAFAEHPFQTARAR